MLSATSLSRLPEFRCLLGLCVAGALSSCTMEQAEGEEGVHGQVSQAVSERYWQDLGNPTSYVNDLSVSIYSSTEPDIWVTGSDGQVYTRRPSSATAWSGPASPSGVKFFYVSAARRGDVTYGVTDVVAADSNTGKVWTTTRDYRGNYSTWKAVGAWDGFADYKPSVSTVTGADRTDVWVAGKEYPRHLWHAYRIHTTGAWSGWIDEGMPSGGLISGPSAYTRLASPLTIDIAARGGSTGLLARAYSNGWYPWAELQGPNNCNPAIATSSSQHIALVFNGVLPEDSASIMMTRWNGSAWVGPVGYAPLPLISKNGWEGCPVFIYNGGLETHPDLYIRGYNRNVLRYTP